MAILMTEAMDIVMAATDIVMEHIKRKRNSLRVSIRILLIPVTKKVILPLITIMVRNLRILITTLINHTTMIIVTPMIMVIPNPKVIILTVKRIKSKN